MVKKTKEQKELKGIVSGVFEPETIELSQTTSKRDELFNSQIQAMLNDKFWVLPEGYSQNSLYVRLRKLRESEELTGVELDYAITKKNDVTQYVLGQKATIEKAFNHPVAPVKKKKKVKEPTPESTAEPIIEQPITQ